MRAKRVLTKKQIDTALKKLPNWRVNSKYTYIKATFSNTDYVSGLVAIARIAVHAEVQHHHPDITYTYDSVTIKLSTHDCNGITKKDITLATTISNLFN